MRFSPKQYQVLKKLLEGDVVKITVNFGPKQVWILEALRERLEKKERAGIKTDLNTELVSTLASCLGAEHGQGSAGTQDCSDGRGRGEELG